MRTVQDLIEALQKIQAELGPKAPAHLLIDDELYDLEINVYPKGNLGPGSVLLTKIPLKK